MNESFFAMLQTVAQAMQADPALAQQQIDLMQKQLPGADALALRELIELCARPGATAQSVAAASAPLLKRIIPQP